MKSAREEDRQGRPGCARRRGITLIELGVAVVVLIAVMTVTVHVLAGSIAERREAERREWAIQEASNVMERVTALPWDEIQPGSSASLRLSRRAREALREGSLSIHVAVDPSGEAKRVNIEVQWANRAGGPHKPVRLSAWVYRQGRRGA